LTGESNGWKTWHLIYFAPNQEVERDETPYMVKISSEVWAHVFGGPLCARRFTSFDKMYTKRNRNETEAEA
jgi:hypothetical protein